MHEQQRQSANKKRRTLKVIASLGLLTGTLLAADSSISKSHDAIPTSSSKPLHKSDRPLDRDVFMSGIYSTELFSAYALKAAAHRHHKAPYVPIKLPVDAAVYRTHSPSVTASSIVEAAKKTTATTTTSTSTTTIPPSTTTTIEYQGHGRESHFRRAEFENSAVNITMTGNNTKDAFDFFIANGYSATQAAGIVGNLMYESGINPTQNEHDGKGYGVAQFTGDELDRLKVWAYVNQEDPNSLQGQLDYIIYDLNNNYQSVASNLRLATTISDATNVFEIQYEKPQGSETSPISGGALATLAPRVQFAQNIYNQFQ